MVNPKAIIAAHTTEEEFLRDILAYAKERGWLCHHCRPARTSKGWATPIQGQKGFPDLVLLRRHPEYEDAVLIVAEVKSEGGVLSLAQEAWLKTFGLFSGAVGRLRMSVYVWRPSQWPEIEQILE